MGNRGTKSITCFNYTRWPILNVILIVIVKAQRVYGGRHGIALITPCLRCTLTGFERNMTFKSGFGAPDFSSQSYPVGSLAKQIKSRMFSTQSKLNTDMQLLDPWFITGYSDAEGSFIISVYKNDSSKLK